MNIVLMTPIRLLADSMTDSLNDLQNINAISCTDISELKDLLTVAQLDIILIDITEAAHEIDLEKLMELANDYPHVPLVALGLEWEIFDFEQKGLGLFSNYINRSVSIHDLYQALYNLDTNQKVISTSLNPELLKKNH